MSKYQTTDLDIAVSLDVDIIVTVMTKYNVNYNTAMNMLNKAKLLPIMNSTEMACLTASDYSLDEIMAQVEEYNKCQSTL